MQLISVADELEAKTQQYWKISRHWNGFSDSNEFIPMEKAFKIIRNDINPLNPTRPLFVYTNIIVDDMINKNKKRKGQIRTEANVLQLTMVAKAEA